MDCAVAVTLADVVCSCSRICTGLVDRDCSREWKRFAQLEVFVDASW